MIKRMLLLILLAAPCYASNIVIFDPNDPDVANAVKKYRRSVNTPDFSSRSDVLINPDLDAVRASGVPVRHWKVSGTSVVVMTQAEQDLIDADRILIGQRRVQRRDSLNRLATRLEDWDSMSDEQKWAAVKVLLQWVRVRDKLGDE